MSYRMKATLAFLWLYCTNTIALLKAVARKRPALMAEIVFWETIRAKVTELQAEQRKLEIELVEKRAIVTVVDLDWDVCVTELSGTAYLASGKKANEDPYATLFGNIKATDARHLGPAKASTFGAYTVAKGRALGNAEITLLLDQLEELNQELDAADADRDKADIALSAFRQGIKGLTREVQTQVANTEIAILKAAPGRRDLVRAVLSPASHEKNAGIRSPLEKEPEVAAPEVDTTPDIELPDAEGTSDE
ncbi:MAG: hypothetical protein HUU55_20230 [Myxococcales bacterium]|nr:hypothetical protein [Myxococcales bacterium]